MKVFFLLIFLFSIFPSCSGKREREHTLMRIYSDPVRFRRPPGPGANPQAGPGGQDFTSDPLPGKNFDCRTADEIFKKFDLKKILACFNTIQSGRKVEYLLKRKFDPELELNDPEDAPECLRKDLSRIPVPREIFVLSGKPMDRPTCFSSRLDIEVGKKAGVRLPVWNLVVNVGFPLKVPVKTESDVLRTLAGWSLTPLVLQDGEPGLAGWVVPEMICKKCFNDRSILDQRPVTYWP